MGVAETLLRGWALEPVPAVGLLLTAVGYLVGARRVRRTSGRAWPARCTGFFLSGALVAGVAVLGPPDVFDETFFSAHMVQHILLTMVAVPLLVLGDPVLLVLRAAPRGARRRWLVPVLRSSALRHLMRPIAGWLLLTAVMLVSHLPPVYDYAVAHPLVHEYLEHPVYVGAALLFFYPLLAPTAGPHKAPAFIGLLSVFTMMIPASLLGFFLYAAPRPLYPFYAHAERPFAPGPLADQQLSGALMWSSSMALTALWLCVAGARFLREEQVRGQRADATLARVVGPAPGTST